MTDYLGRVWAIRYFWLNLAAMDIRTRYRGSTLGLAWSLLQPLGMTVILTVVFSTLFGMSRSFYAPYVMSGMVCWSFLQLACVQGCSCFLLNEKYIRQVPAPLAIYPLRAILGNVFHFVIGIALVAMLALTLRGRLPILPLLSLIPSIVVLAAFGWSLAVIFGMVNVWFRDTHHIAEVGLQALYFLTPIIYEPSLLIAKGLGLVVWLNPVVPFIMLFRAPIMDGAFPAATTYAAAVGITMASVGLATLLLWKQSRKFIFYL